MTMLKFLRSGQLSIVDEVKELVDTFRQSTVVTYGRTDSTRTKPSVQWKGERETQLALRQTVPRDPDLEADFAYAPVFEDLGGIQQPVALGRA